jgi:hypothetical protein
MEYTTPGCVDSGALITAKHRALWACHGLCTQTGAAEHPGSMPFSAPLMERTTPRAPATNAARKEPVEVQAFMYGKEEGYDYNVQSVISWRAWYLTILSALTGSCLSVGTASHSKDVKAQTVATCQSIGLISALLLGSAMGKLSSAFGEEGLMNTDPAYIGPVHTVLLFVATISLFFATITSVFITVCMNQTCSKFEQRFLVERGKAELAMPVYYSALGLVSYWVALIIWAIIRCFSLTATTEPSTPQTYPYTFVVCAVFGALATILVYSKIFNLLARAFSQNALEPRAHGSRSSPLSLWSPTSRQHTACAPPRLRATPSGASVGEPSDRPAVLRPAPAAIPPPMPGPQSPTPRDSSLNRRPLIECSGKRGS